MKPITSVLTYVLNLNNKAVVRYFRLHYYCCPGVIPRYAAIHRLHQYEKPTNHDVATLNCFRSLAHYPVFDLGNASDDFVDAADASIVQNFPVVVCGFEDDGPMLKELHHD